MNPEITTEYCPKCERETSHREVEDEIFEFAKECMVCNIVWEYSSIEYEDFNLPEVEIKKCLN